MRPGFRWDSADAFLFDIDGTLLNSGDAVHYFAFRNAIRDAINARLPQIVEQMCAEVRQNREQLSPELCPSILELLMHLQTRGKLLGAASGNLETVGWLKLEKAGLRPLFAFGSFSFPRELRSEIFQHGIDLARQRLGGNASVTVVGDTPLDIEAARTTGVPVIALATGIYSFAQLQAHGPDACFACGTDLLALAS